MTDFTLSTPNSPNFNERNWVASREALAFSNAPKRTLAKVAASAIVLEHVAPRVSPSVNRLNVIRNPSIVFDDAPSVPFVAPGFDAAEIPQSPSPKQRAELLGYTVKTLRAQCKAEGLRRYSSAPKATLVDMLLGTQSG
jgi:hypothetical protein